jgi:hypothetical protein
MHELIYDILGEQRPHGHRLSARTMEQLRDADHAVRQVYPRHLTYMQALQTGDRRKYIPTGLEGRAWRSEQPALLWQPVPETQVWPGSTS